MITGIVVVMSLLLAGVFSLARLLMPDLRERIERPTLGFLERLDSYDRSCGARRDADR